MSGNASGTVEWLVELYGDNPQEVGVVDGTEDDYGDLLVDAAHVLGLGEDGFLLIQDIAASSTSTTMAEWIAEIRAALPAG